MRPSFGDSARPTSLAQARTAARALVMATDSGRSQVGGGTGRTLP